MTIHKLTREQLLPVPLLQTFDFFADPGNLDSITPPWLNFQILEAPREIRKNSRIRYKLRWHRIPIRWTAEIERWDAPHAFVDVQIHGPYRRWHHLHEFEAVEGGTRMRDTVHYALPFGPLGELFHPLLVRSDVEEIFNYRARVIAARL